ncbi:MAG: glutamine--fructose-6-phosphate aminotransferase, partial [Planctomycetota bacterium]
MCGIFGYIGPKAGQNILLESLKRLEYRGYDSWGVALGQGDSLAVQQHPGRIPQSPDVDTKEPDSASRGSSIWGGIAHTRWAT